MLEQASTPQDRCAAACSLLQTEGTSLRPQTRRVVTTVFWSRCRVNVCGLPLGGGPRRSAVSPPDPIVLRGDGLAQPAACIVGRGRTAYAARPGWSLFMCLAL